MNLSNFIHGVIQDCNFWNIKGRAIYCDLASNWHAYRCQTRHCGDDNKPAWQLGDTTGSCYCHILRCFFEQNQDADVVRIPGQGSLGSNGVSFTDCGFEQETNDKPEQVQTFINGIGGVGWIRGCTFGRNNATQVILNYPFADVSHNTFTQPAGTVPALQLAVTAYQSKIFDNQYNGAAGAGRAFEVAASNCIISGNTMHAGGTIYSAGGYNIISGNKVISCKAAESATVLAQIESVGGHNNVIEGNIIDGEGTATLRGIFSAGDESVVAGNIVTRLDNATGIQTNGSRGTVTGNICTSLGGGQAFYISLPDNVVENNYPRTLNRNNGGVATTLTIAAGVININSSGAYGGSFKIDTEGAAASDDLDTINGGTEGDVIYLRAANDARTVVLKHGTGNLQVGLNVNFSLNSQYDLAIAYYTGAKWIVTGVNAGT